MKQTPSDEKTDSSTTRLLHLRPRLTANRLLLAPIALVAGIALSDVALAYIGPGAGLSAIGTVVAVLGAVLLVIVGFVWYPVKRLLRKRKSKKDKLEEEPVESEN